jgi:hypothetical protein
LVWKSGAGAAFTGVVMVDSYYQPIVKKYSNGSFSDSVKSLGMASYYSAISESGKYIVCLTNASSTTLNGLCIYKYNEDTGKYTSAATANYLDDFLINGNLATVAADAETSYSSDKGHLCIVENEDGTGAYISILIKIDNSRYNTDLLDSAKNKISGFSKYSDYSNGVVIFYYDEKTNKMDLFKGIITSFAADPNTYSWAAINKKSYKNYILYCLNRRDSDYWYTPGQIYLFNAKNGALETLQFNGGYGYKQYGNISSDLKYIFYQRNFSDADTQYALAYFNVDDKTFTELYCSTSTEHYNRKQYHNYHLLSENEETYLTKGVSSNTLETWKLTNTAQTNLGSYSNGNIGTILDVAGVGLLDYKTRNNYSTNGFFTLSYNNNQVVTNALIGFTENYGRSVIGNSRIIDPSAFAYVDQGIPKVTLTASGTWTVPSGVSSIEIFCVGGGGGAGGTHLENRHYNDGSYTTQYCYGSSGAGGYTSTVKNISVTPGETLTITIGTGGTGGNCIYDSDENGTNGITSTTNGTAGGVTSVKRGSTVLCSANGGKGGNAAYSAGGHVTGVDGGSGSGGCASSWWGSDNPSTAGQENGSDGSNGSDGEYGRYNYTESVSGGKGQGSTTRAFGTLAGTLYSTAGGNPKANPVANTGHGGRRFQPTSTSDKTASNGSSGVVLIRY